MKIEKNDLIKFQVLGAKERMRKMKITSCSTARVCLSNEDWEKWKLLSFLTSFHFCELVVWWKSTHWHLLTKLGAFESPKALKAWKSKLCSFCEFPARWKCTQRHLLTKLVAFESSKVWKSNLCSFYELHTWWKSTQRSLLTKLVAFESSKT